MNKSTINNYQEESNYEEKLRKQQAAQARNAMRAKGWLSSYEKQSLRDAESYAASLPRIYS